MQIARMHASLSNCYHEGRRQYDSQQNIFKFESRLKSIMSSSNPAAAGKFYDDNYVIVKSAQIIIRSNIKPWLIFKRIYNGNTWILKNI